MIVESVSLVVMTPLRRLRELLSRQRDVGIVLNISRLSDLQMILHARPPNAIFCAFRQRHARRSHDLVAKAHRVTARRACWAFLFR